MHHVQSLWTQTAEAHVLGGCWAGAGKVTASTAPGGPQRRHMATAARGRGCLAGRGAPAHGAAASPVWGRRLAGSRCDALAPGSQRMTGTLHPFVVSLQTAPACSL